MLYPRSPIDAFHADLRGLGNGSTDGTPDSTTAAWLAVATVIHRLTQLPRSARREYAERAATVVLEAALPESAAGAVCDALLRLGEPEGPERAVLAVQGMAEEMENAGAFHLAYTTLAVTRLALLEDGPRATGLALAQQERIARQLGELDTAADLYESVRETGEACGDRELTGRAAVGRGILANMRGNYPEARAAYEAALAAAPDVLAVASMAHHGLMLAASAASDVNMALAHGWRAFESAAGDPARRADMLINLAELCQRAEQYTAALRGYQAALVLTRLPRLRLVALSGAAIAAGHLGKRALLAELARSAEAEIPCSGLPYESAVAWLELAEAHAQVGASAEVARYLAHAMELATAGGFHEIHYRADAVAAQKIAPLAGTSELTDTSREVVRRLAELPDNTGLAVLVG